MGTFARGHASCAARAARLRTQVISAVAGLAAISGAAQAQAPQKTSLLPPVQATTLAGTALTLPVPGKITLLAIGFSRASGAAAGVAWKQVQPFCAAHPQVNCYQVAVLQDAPGWIRSMIVRSLRNARTEAERAQFATVVEKEAAWKQALQDTDARDGYAVLTGSDGRILWMQSGQESTLHVDLQALAAHLPQ